MSEQIRKELHETVAMVINIDEAQTELFETMNASHEALKERVDQLGSAVSRLIARIEHLEGDEDV